MNKAGFRAWLACAMIAVHSLAFADVLSMPKADAPAPAPAAEQPVEPPTMPMMDEPADAPAQAPAEATPESAAPAPQPLSTDSSAKTVPGRGMTMEQVEARFGAPREKVPAVGDPPITRWNYGWYTVYFEHNIVLDSVIHHK